MKKEFQLLTYKEENNLSLEQKEQYYEELRKYVLSKPLKTTTKGATTIAPKLKGFTDNLSKQVVRIFAPNCNEWKVEGQENIPNGPVVFAQTHQGLLDNFIWISNVKQHSLILHSKDVNRMLLAAQLNTGLVLVEKGNRENNQDAKLDMIRLLIENHSITYFPEGTWLLSPNKLHLPLNYGFLDVARKTNVPVVPVVHEFTYDTTTEKEKITKIHTRFGKPIYITAKDDIFEKLRMYEEAISTMRWEMIEEKGLEHRDDITNWDYINFLKGNYKNLEWGQIDVNRERKYIFQSDNEFYKFFHVNDVPFDQEGNLLETEEVQRLREINRNHGV